jgi:hypothetical protein
VRPEGLGQLKKIHFSTSLNKILSFKFLNTGDAVTIKGLFLKLDV